MTVSVEGNGDGLLLTIGDTGIGIPREEHGQVFSRFFAPRPRPATRSRGRGSGSRSRAHSSSNTAARSPSRAVKGRGRTCTVVAATPGGWRRRPLPALRCHEARPRARRRRTPAGRRSAHALRPPTASRCTIFPATNAWNARVDTLPVAASSAQMIAVDRRRRRSAPRLRLGALRRAADRHPVRRRVEETATLEGLVRLRRRVRSGPISGARDGAHRGRAAVDGDRHALLLDKDGCKLYELFALYPKGGGWHAGSGAVWNLRSNAPAPGRLDIGGCGGPTDLPGARAVRRGRARHDRPRASLHRVAHAARHVYPARHYASSSDDPALPPMGLRVRLKASVDISGFPRQSRVVLQALKTYGMILADNGSNWYISGRPSPKLVERRPPLARQYPGLGLRGCGHVVASSVTKL